MEAIPKKQHEPTNEFASSLCIKTETVHRSLCVNGHYMGIKPIKLPNGRLLWPIDEKRKMIEKASGGN